MERDYQHQAALLLDQLKTQRDELKVRLNLAKLEARDEWDMAEKKWFVFKSKSEKIIDEIDRSSDDVVAAAKLLGEELKDIYQRIKRQL